MLCIHSDTLTWKWKIGSGKTILLVFHVHVMRPRERKKLSIEKFLKQEQIGRLCHTEVLQ